MLTLETLLKVIRQRETYGSDDGACFGTSDPSRLRPPTTPTDLALPQEKPSGQTRAVEPSRE